MRGRGLPKYKCPEAPYATESPDAIKSYTRRRSYHEHYESALGRKLLCAREIEEGEWPHARVS